MIHTFDFRFPFYYEVKILLLIWLISPVSRGSLGSSIIYRKFVHPALMKREDVSCIPECYIKTYIKCEIIRVMAGSYYVTRILSSIGNRSYDASSSRSRIQVLGTIWWACFYVCQQLCHANGN